MRTITVPVVALLALLLSSCAVTVQPGGTFEVQGVTVTGDAVVSERLGLGVYPGAAIVSREEKRSSAKATFTTGASLDSVYDHFHGQLAARGWRRGEYEQKTNKVEAEYHLGGEELELELHREGRSGRYRIEIKFD